MTEMLLSATMVDKLEQIYEEMEASYDRVARELDFSCRGCPDNCCDSYFLHHTYVEWSYLLRGFHLLSTAKREELEEKSRRYIIACEREKRLGRRPQIMCPLNEDGLCILYKHRLMICRTHGVPAVFRRPDGERISFPGCFRCQEKVSVCDDSPTMERTQMLQKLAKLENEFLQNRRHIFPKVKLTIAEMLVKGQPCLPSPLCAK